MEVTRKKNLLCEDLYSQKELVSLEDLENKWSIDDVPDDLENYPLSLARSLDPDHHRHAKRDMCRGESVSDRLDGIAYVTYPRVKEGTGRTKH